MQYFQWPLVFVTLWSWGLELCICLVKINSLERISVSLTKCICSRSLDQFRLKQKTPQPFLHLEEHHSFSSVNQCTNLSVNHSCEGFLGLCHFKTSLKKITPPTITDTLHHTWPLWEAQDESALSCFWFWKLYNNGHKAAVLPEG